MFQVLTTFDVAAAVTILFLLEQPISFLCFLNIMSVLIYVIADLSCRQKLSLRTIFIQ